MIARQPPLDYRKLCIKGIDDNSAIVAGEFFREGNVTWDADETTTEFKIDFADPRYQACLATAHELKAKYPLAGLDPDCDHELIVEREQKIVQALNHKIHEQFGNYNPAVSADLKANRDSSSEPTLHDDIKRSHTSNPAKSSEFSKDEFICREYSPVDSNLCDEAGLPNFFVSGYSNSFGMAAIRGVPVLAPGDNNGRIIGHTFMVSRLSGNIFEGTASGNTAYVYNLSDTSLEDFLAGKTIVGTSYERGMATYGTGDTGDHPVIIQNRHEKLAMGELQELPCHERTPFVPCLPDQAPTYEAKVGNFDFSLAQQTYSKQMLPLMMRFEEAVKKGDVATAAECSNDFPFSKERLAEKLKETIANADLPMSELMINRGALQGFSTPYGASDALFAMPADKVAGNKPFVEAMIKKLDIKPATHLHLAAQSGNAEHVDIALERIDCEPRTPELKRDLLKAEIMLYKNGNTEAAEAVKCFLDTEYKDVVLPSPPEQKSESVVDIFLQQNPLVTECVDTQEWHPPMLTPAMPNQKITTNKR